MRRAPAISALLLTALTGFAGLAYEVTWQKYLAILLGSHAEATAGVLAIFLGGLSAGYAIFGQITRRRATRAMATGGSARLLTLYAVVEGGIGAYALLFPSLFRFVSRSFALRACRSHTIVTKRSLGSGADDGT